MYKLILVDDEARVRTNIYQLIQWQTFQMEVVGSCNNAVEALEIMVDIQPDILMTDIKMPVMNGLELIRQAKEMYPFLQCIVLSGYDEFAFAQEAMRYGASEYLLKPCLKEDIEAVLTRCTEALKMQYSGTVYRYQQRKGAVARLCQNLMGIKNVDDDAGVFSQLLELLKTYGDISIFLEAAIALSAQYGITSLEGSSILHQMATCNTPNMVFAQMDLLLKEIHTKSDLLGTPVMKAVQYIEQNYHKANLSLQYVADEVVHMNAQYFGKCFIKQMNMKFGDYVLKVRMEQAQLLLKEGRLKSAEIACQVGLGENIQYFYHLFKRYTGMTPKEYQQGCQK